jgi:hypothetical protein
MLLADGSMIEHFYAALACGKGAICRWKTNYRIEGECLEDRPRLDCALARPHGRHAYTGPTWWCIAVPWNEFWKWRMPLQHMHLPHWAQRSPCAGLSNASNSARNVLTMCYVARIQPVPKKDVSAPAVAMLAS